MDSIGFVWGDMLEDQLLKKFIELREFKEKHGHTVVLQSMNKQLARWMNRQRQKCDRENRTKMLDSLGFIWKFKST